jgi:hypothetical protein
MAVRLARRAVFSFSGFRVAVGQVAYRGDCAAVVNRARADDQEPVDDLIGRGHKKPVFLSGPTGDCRRKTEKTAALGPASARQGATPLRTPDDCQYNPHGRAMQGSGEEAPRSTLARAHGRTKISKSLGGRLIRVLLGVHHSTLHGPSLFFQQPPQLSPLKVQ